MRLPATWRACFNLVCLPGVGSRPRLTDTVLFWYYLKKWSERLLSGWHPAGAGTTHELQGLQWLGFLMVPDNQDTLYFWVKTIKNPVIGFQYFPTSESVILKGNYYRYAAATSILNNANLVWKRYQFPSFPEIPLSAGTMSVIWTLTAQLCPEFHADTWDYGYTLWLDGLQFFALRTADNRDEGKQYGKKARICRSYPNPFSAGHR